MERGRQRGFLQQVRCFSRCLSGHSPSNIYFTHAASAMITKTLRGWSSCWRDAVTVFALNSEDAYWVRSKKDARDSRKYRHFARTRVLPPSAIFVYSPTTRSFQPTWPHTDHRWNVLLLTPQSPTHYTQKTPCCS